MVESKILSINLAIAKKAELDAERQRVAQGSIPAPRMDLIDHVYSKPLTHIQFYKRSLQANAYRR